MNVADILTGYSAETNLAREAEAIFDELRCLTGDANGITRETYGAGESVGLDLIERIARENGLQVERDAVANLVVTLEGADPTAPALWVGSHMDAVPHGGNFDGAAGIIAGLLCQIRFRREGRKPPRTVKVIGFRGEESAWFGTGYIGSRALLGMLKPDDLSCPHRDTKESLRDRMQALGIDTAPLDAGTRLIDPKSIAAYYELHIEQGPVMVARDLPVGIVTGIRGNFRHVQARCIGEAGHSGAVPRWLRRDAVLAVASLLSRMDEHWQELLQQGEDLVFTSGILSTNPGDHAVTRIPGEATFSIDVRSQSAETLSQVRTLLEQECAAIAKERKVEFQLGRLSTTAPATMDPGLVTKLGRIAAARGIKAEELPSGAGHDAQMFAQGGVPAAMIFVRNANGSHNPEEAMDIHDFLLGTDVLFHALSEAP